jgi:hypothetical protein
MSLKVLIFILGAAILFVLLAWSPLVSRSVGEPVIITSDPSTPTALQPTADLTAAGFTQTPAGSYFTVTTDSSCYNGPDVSYELVMRILSGDKVEVIGRNQENTWWRISNDKALSCWIANEAGTFYGEAGLIPITSSQYATKAWTPLPTKRVQTAEPTTADDSAPVPATDPVQQPVNTPVPAATNTSPPPTQAPPTIDILPTIIPDLPTIDVPPPLN